MALQGPIPVEFDQVFPHGAFAVGEVVQVDDFDKSTKDKRVQQIDKTTGVRMWQVRVMDADPEVRRGEVVVKVLADVMPVLPDAIAGTPIRAVEFTGMTVTPYVEERPGGRARLAYSVKATGVQAPTTGRRQPPGEKSTAEAKAG